MRHRTTDLKFLHFGTLKAQLADAIGKTVVRACRVRSRVTPERLDEAKNALNSVVLSHTPKDAHRSRSSQLSQLWAEVERHPRVAWIWAKDGNKALKRPSRDTDMRWIWPKVQRRVMRLLALNNSSASRRAHKTRSRSRQIVRLRLTRVVRQQSRALAVYVPLCKQLLETLREREVNVGRFLLRKARAERMARSASRTAKKVLAR